MYLFVLQRPGFRITPHNCCFAESGRRFPWRIARRLRKPRIAIVRFLHLAAAKSLT